MIPTPKPWLSLRIATVQFLGLLLISTWCAASDADHPPFPPWEEQVFVEMGKRHGEAAAKRMRETLDFIIANQYKPIQEKLELTNDFMNGLPWIADPDLWKREDYWATPFETLTTFGGDCEDIAISKYVVLRLMGVSDKKMGFAQVVTSSGENHMVLLYKPSKETPSLILDNQHTDVLPSTRRPDLVGVYIFQNDGTLYLLEDRGGGDRSLKTKIKNRRLEKWASAKDRARANRELYQQYNGGRPLIPEWATSIRLSDD